MLTCDGYGTCSQHRRQHRLHDVYKVFVPRAVRAVAAGAKVPAAALSLSRWKRR